MIQGYDELDNNIVHTTELIEDVALAAKEQLSGIDQINNAISELDQVTQANATMATDTNQIAIYTDKIAKEVVDEVNEKEFDGRDTIDISDVKNTRAAKVAAGENINLKFSKKSKTNLKQENIQVSTKTIDVPQNNDEWDSF